MGCAARYRVRIPLSRFRVAEEFTEVANLEEVAQGKRFSSQPYVNGQKDVANERFRGKGGLREKKSGRSGPFPSKKYRIELPRWVCSGLF